jgi:hypothetical protein
MVEYLPSKSKVFSSKPNTTKNMLPVPVTLCSAGLEVLVPEREVPHRDTTVIPLDRKLQRHLPQWPPRAQVRRLRRESGCWQG